MSSALTNRVIFSDNGTLKDISIPMVKYRSDTEVIDYVAAEDFIFIGSQHPFNHRFIDVSVANAQASEIKIELWDANEWVEAVDVQDETAVSGASLGQSGHITWSMNKRESWHREDTNQDGEEITGLEGVVIYNLYWARISWNADLDAATALNMIGHKFSEDDDLNDYYPDLLLTDVINQFQTGKTDWTEQHFAAAREIIRDLTMKNIIWSKDQILDFRHFNLAAVHKVAEIAFNGFGKSFVDERKAAHAAYKQALNLNIFNVDRNKNTRLDPAEQRTTTGWMTR